MPSKKTKSKKAKKEFWCPACGYQNAKKVSCKSCKTKVCPDCVAPGTKCNSCASYDFGKNIRVVQSFGDKKIYASRHGGYVADAKVPLETSRDGKAPLVEISIQQWTGVGFHLWTDIREDRAVIKEANGRWFDPWDLLDGILKTYGHDVWDEIKSRDFTKQCVNEAESKAFIKKTLAEEYPPSKYPVVYVLFKSGMARDAQKWFYKDGD